MAGILSRPLYASIVVALLTVLLPASGVGGQMAFASSSRCPSGYYESDYDTNNHSHISITARIDIYGCTKNGNNAVKQYIISIWGPGLQNRVFGWRLWRCGTFYGSGHGQLISGSTIDYAENYTDRQSTRTIVRPNKDWGTPLLAMTTGDIAGYDSNCPSQADTVGSSVEQGGTAAFPSHRCGVFYANVVYEDGECNGS